MFNVLLRFWLVGWLVLFLNFQRVLDAQGKRVRLILLVFRGESSGQCFWTLWNSAYKREICTRCFVYLGEMWAGEKKKKSKCMLVYLSVLSLEKKKKRLFKCNKIILQDIIAATAFGTKLKMRV